MKSATSKHVSCKKKTAPLAIVKMKIIGPVVFILIAGILSSTNAQSRDQEMELECTRNGGPEAYESLTIGVSNLKNSSETHAREILQAYYSSGITAALTAYCNKLEDINNAVNSFTQAVKPCLKPSDREMPGLNNFTASVLRFPCANSNLVEAVHNSTDRQCLTSKHQAVADCGREMFSSLNAASTDPAQHEADCRLAQTFEQCTVRVLGECEDQIFSTSLDSLYNYINNYLPCENLTKSPIQN